MFTDESLYQNLFLFLFFSFYFQSLIGRASLTVNPIIIQTLQACILPLFLLKRLWGRERKEEGGYGSDAVKSRDFLLRYPLLLCLFSVYFLFKKGGWEFCFIGGRVGRKKEKRGIIAQCDVPCIYHLRCSIRSIWRLSPQKVLYMLTQAVLELIMRVIQIRIVGDKILPYREYQ